MLNTYIQRSSFQKIQTIKRRIESKKSKFQKVEKSKSRKMTHIDTSLENTKSRQHIQTLTRSQKRQKLHYRAKRRIATNTNAQ